MIMNKKNWVLLIVCFFVLSTQAKNFDYEKVTVNGKQYYLYKVEKSEGFYSISNKFGVQQEDITEANPETKNGLKVGQKIKIPVISESKNKKENIISHTVAKGETIFSISKKYDVTEESIYKLNPESKQALRVGSILKINSSLSTTKAKEVSQNSLKTKKNLQDNNDIPKTTIIKSENENLQEYREHIVKRKETLYSISKEYNVSVDDIIKLNPSVSKGLEVKSVLRIPGEKAEKKYQEVATGAFQKKETTNDETILATQTLITPKEEQEEKIAVPEIKPTNKVKLAILLPFDLNAEVRDANMNRFMEFYEGSLLAIDSLRKTGLSVEVNTFDIGKTQSQLTSVLAKPEMKTVDIIIGPAYTSQITSIGEFAKENKIKVVVPFSPNIKELATNKYIFQVISPQDDLTEPVNKEFCRLFANKEIVIVNPKKDDANDKKDFITALKKKMNDNKMSFTSFIANTNTTHKIDSIAKAANKDIVVVVPTTDIVALTQIGNAIEQTRQPNISVFGFPEWHSLQLTVLYSKPLYSYTNHYINFNDSKTIKFFTDFRYNFGISNTQSVPNYAALGYDLSFYFLSLIEHYGKNFEKEMKNTTTELLQMNLMFEQVSATGGYINKGVFMQSFNESGINSLK